MKLARVAIVLGALAMLAAALVIQAWSWNERATVASTSLLVLVLALCPARVRTFIFEHRWHLVRYLFVAGTTGTAVGLMQRIDTEWLRVAGTVACVVACIATLLLDPVFRGWLLDLTWRQWRAIDAETERDPTEAGNASWKILVILVVVAVSLTLQEYIGDRAYFEHLFPPRGRIGHYWELAGFAWWSGWRVLGYVVIPSIAIALMPGQRIRDVHVSPRGFFKHLWIYALLFSLVLPAVLKASTTGAFRHTYPFYRLANRSYGDLWMWEALYAAQFVSLEFFFRGFILQGLRRALGSNSIFVMIVPYCMIHYGKPMPETLGAIGAGVILGTIAMRTKSIWGGVLIHIGVAMTMDVLALRGCPPIGSGHWCGD